LPGFAEYLYFALMFYGMLADAWGFSIPLLAPAGLLALAMYCLWRLIKSGISLEPIALPLGCAASFLIIQIIIHDGSPMDDALRVFVTWIFALIIIRSLCLRDGFFHRFAFATLALGVLFLPYLVLNYNTIQTEPRAGLESSIGVANPNDLAAWFGFCCVYCIIVAIETRRSIVRVAALLVAAGCLFVVGLTVTRGALVAAAIATVIASRRILKRGFLAILLLLVVGSGIFVSGVFDESIGLYNERGTEETGRLLVWPLAIERFFESPIIGVGVSKSATYVPASGAEITPHNSFLYLALSSGIIPFALFLAYWITACGRALKSNSRQIPETPFLLPLFIYTLIMCSLVAGEFFYPWAIVTLSMAMSASAYNQVPKRTVRLVAGERPAMRETFHIRRSS
jgi:O-antigen ligase